MKKRKSILFSICLLVSLTACGNFKELGASGNTIWSGSDGRGSAEQSEALAVDEETQTVQDCRVLVAYFSATGATRGVAETIAGGMGADLYEIIPEDPYTDSDLDYTDSNSRSMVEQNDPDARPAISGSVDHMEQYDIVFIGYPIWCNDAPRIVDTFVESYDFSGKTIVPFCTSDSGSIGDSVINLEELIPDAMWFPGSCLNGNDSLETIMEWLDSLGLLE